MSDNWSPAPIFQGQRTKRTNNPVGAVAGVVSFDGRTAHLPIAVALTVARIGNAGAFGVDAAKLDSAALAGALALPAIPIRRDGTKVYPTGNITNMGYLALDNSSERGIGVRQEREPPRPVDPATKPAVRPSNWR